MESYHIQKLIAFSRGMIVVASAGNEGSTFNPHIGRQPMQFQY
jgi:hypothetical protein